MLRYQLFLTFAVAFGSAWYYALSHRRDWSLSEESSLAILLAPVIAIVALGVYLLSRLVWGVLSYEDFPEASKEIEGQIEEAKKELRKRKIIQ